MRCRGLASTARGGSRQPVGHLVGLSGRVQFDRHSVADLEPIEDPLHPRIGREADHLGDKVVEPVAEVADERGPDAVPWWSGCTAASSTSATESSAIRYANA